LQRGETLPTQNYGSHPGLLASGSSSPALVRRGRASFPAGGPPDDTQKPIGSGTELQRCAPYPVSPRTEFIEPTEPTEHIEHIEPTEPIVPTELMMNGHHRSQRLPSGAQNTPEPQDPPAPQGGPSPNRNERNTNPDRTDPEGSPTPSNHGANTSTPEPQDPPDFQEDPPRSQTERNPDPNRINPEGLTPPKGHRANIRIATLNMRGMRGCSSPLTGPGPISKWTAVTKALRSRQIEILALQESHLSTELATQVEQLFSRCLTLFNSPALENPSGSAGVTFVINKEKLDTNDITLTTLIPGRAVFLSVPRKNSDTLHLMNVYAPNDLAQHTNFWAEVTACWSANHLPHPHMMTGDFNLVEDPIDRAPARCDSVPAVTALRTCRQALGLQDIWRQTFPDERSFSYISPHNMMSRIDRIYAHTEIGRCLSDWIVETSEVPLDHRMTLVWFTPQDAPFIGKGHWSWPIGLLHDKPLNEKIHALGLELQERIRLLPPNDRASNVQTVWQQFKDDIKKEASTAAKSQMSKISKRISALKKDMLEAKKSTTQAYDKIDHHYLLETLKRFQLPDRFINTVHSLYEKAETAIIINGVASSPFSVTWGVRQGDPLSCLLFNLAIEPLACLLRNSPRLQGYSIPGVTQKIIVSLYADDTTIYLLKTDSYSELLKILTKWCTASGAKFNIEKTEVIPTGTKPHRQHVVATRRINPTDPPLPQEIKIVEDGNATRSLGAWIGNEVKEATPWEPILNKVRTTLQRWNKGHPTLDAKQHIVQMFAGGMTQFLTKAQGMPRQIEDALIKIICTFIWDESTAPPTIGIKKLYAPKDQGGISLLNIPA